MASIETSEFLEQNLDILCCPRCIGDLQVEGEALRCSACGHTFEIAGNIPLLFAPNDWASAQPDVTEPMKEFYEETPFPNYEEFDSTDSLMNKARQGVFAKLLDDQVPPGARIIECGCGTGQFTNFLSIANRNVFGTDMCLNSLRLGQNFKDENELTRAHFLQMNLFRPCFKPGSFDLVISNGVLHHTSDPRLAFETISGLARPGGYVLVGLYHRYGRLITDLRRAALRLTGDRTTFLDPTLRGADASSPRWRAWFRDQYKNPHESKHTMGQVLTWMRGTGLEFVSSIPKSRPFDPIRDDHLLFKPQRLGSRVERLAVELAMVARGSREGGFFIMIGRKPE